MDLNYLESLVRKAKLGDKRSIKEILKEFTPLIVKYSNSIYLSSYTQQDLIQEGYLSLLKIIHVYDLNKKRFVAYASTAIKNNYNYLIRQKAKENFEMSYNKKVSSDNDCEIVDAFPSDYDFLEDIFQNEELKNLQKAFKALNKKEKDIIYQYYFMDVSMSEYTLKYNITYYQCRGLRNRALKHLKKYMNID